MKDWARAEEIVRQMSGGRITPDSDETKEFLHPEVIEILETGVDEERLPPTPQEDQE